ncbi:MAG: MerR family transcriptional regulator [Acidobacteria bacterium]|nr:MAG: MerR family transcriptional regulator [Acidobacteriota bacterium]
MPDPLIEIPDRAAFKASEVCEIAQIPPYVLRSWEKEFPNLGVAAKPGGPKVYRRSDIEQVLRIKQLLFSEGLTLAGVRRKLEGEPPPEPDAPIELPIPDEVKAKVGRVKQELRSLLDLLGAPKEGVEEPKQGEKEPAATASRASARGTWPPAPGTASGSEPPTAPHANEAGRPVTAGGEDSEPALPLLDAEPETATPPPAASVPPSPRKRRTKR